MPWIAIPKWFKVWEVLTSPKYLLKSSTQSSRSSIKISTISNFASVDRKVTTSAGQIYAQSICSPSATFTQRKVYCQAIWSIWRSTRISRSGTIWWWSAIAGPNWTLSFRIAWPSASRREVNEMLLVWRQAPCLALLIGLARTSRSRKISRASSSLLPRCRQKQIRFRETSNTQSCKPS